MILLSSLRRPLQASLARTLLESTLGYLPFLLVAGIGRALGSTTSLVAAAFVVVLGWCWMTLWPAYRLRPLRQRWWLGWVLGAPRVVCAGLVISIVASLITLPVWSAAAGTLSLGNDIPVSPSITAGFVFARAVFRVAYGVRHRVRRRLRWQLMVSHALVIVLTLVTITALGSVVGTQLLLLASRPDTTTMARSVADDLRISGTLQPFDRIRTEGVLRELENGTLPLRGQAPIANLIPRLDAPVRILVLRPDGRVLAGVRERRPVSGVSWDAIFGRRQVWLTLRRKALAGVAVSGPLTAANGRDPRGFEVGVAPLRSGRDKVTALAVIEVPQIEPSVNQYLQGTLAVFSVSTVLLILATALPLLALSFLFSYVLARNLTRRLESVSAVTTAIAAGDLRQRASVTSENEIGRLADNVNQMAAHLETTVGELDDARGRAVAALDARQQLVASISHELRTPLAVIKAQLETLHLHRPVAAGHAAPALESDIKVPAETLHALETEANRLASLIDDLFALSQSDAGRLQVQCTPIDVGALIDEVAAMMRPLSWQEGRVAVSVEIPSGLPAALADEDRLRQILANLIRNAVRHTPDGGIIALSTGYDDRWVVLVVADTGEGIPAEHLPHIFDRFYRVDQARGRDTGGAGLGLAIVQELVELMGGHVTAESQPNEGSIFRVFLPRVPREDVV